MSIFSSNRPVLRLFWIVGIAFGITFVIFGRAITLPFFFDDLVQLPYLDQFSLWELWLSAGEAPYYRPLTFSVWKLLYLAFDSHNKVAHHLLNLILHALNGAMVGCLSLDLYRAYRLRAQILPAWQIGLISSVIYLIFPFHYQTVPWPGTLVQILVTTLTLSAILFYLIWLTWQENRQRRLFLILAILATALAPFAHENGVLIGPIIFLIELSRSRTLDWRALILRPFLFTLPAILWLPLRLTVVTGRESLTLFENSEAVYQNFVYFFQGLTFPLTLYGQRLMGLTGWGDFTTIWLLGGLALVVAAFSGFISRFRLWRPLLLGIGWWLLGIGPALAVFDFDYVIKGPRLMTLAAVGIALFWEAAVLGFFVSSPQTETQQARLRRVSSIIGAGLAVFLIAGGSTFLWRQMNHYALIGEAYDQAVVWSDRAAEAEQQIVFINFPARVVKQPLTFAVGHEGVSFWPVYAPHSSIITLNGGPADADPVFLSYDGLRLEQPYLYNLINPNGDLGELVNRSDLMIIQTKYDDQSIELVPYGTIETESATNPPSIGTLGTFQLEDGSTGIRLLDAKATPTENSYRLDLTWAVEQPPNEWVTLFVHGVNPAVGLVAQSDGDGFGGIYPPGAWSISKQLHEIRYLPKTEDAVSEIHIGFYDRRNGVRLQLLTSNGETMPDGAYKLELP